MSDRLISAYALRQRMYHDAFETDTEMQRWDGGCWIRYKMFENALEDAPTIDAEPVRHGYWIGVSQTNMTILEKLFFPSRVFKCSVCGNYLDFDGVNAGRGSANYCPNCGAKMDEVEDEQKD